MMKKIYTYTMMALLSVLAMTTVTSCMTEDEQLAWDLNGIWSGTVIGDYYYDRYGLVGDVYDTEICFYQEGDFSRGGTGYQIDLNRETGYYTRYYFDWSVRNGRIHLYYDDGYEIVIRDYEIYDVGRTTRFRGYFDDAYDGSPIATFDLVKTYNMRSVVDDEGAKEVSKEEFK